MYGFSRDRISKWESHIEKWEHELVDYLCGTRMKKMGYRIKYKKFPEKGLDLMSKDNLLKRDYKDFLNLIKEQMLNSMIHLILKIGSQGKHLD